MITLKTINVIFGTHHVLKNITCTIEPGDFIVIVGTNGAGKSTLFDTIAGNVRPSSGTITLDGIDITPLDNLERSSMITRLFQNPHHNSVGSMTVRQNLALASYSRKSAQLLDGMRAMPPEQAQKILAPLNIPTEHLLEKPMSSLSGGQRQLIAFMMATQQIPKLLLLDEPTAALDPQAATKLLKLAYQFTQQHKIATLLITHDPEIALNMGNKIWVLEQGMITKQFGSQDKNDLRAADLIGHIDYAQLMR
jgi:putative tryptophan/tyrosine transport system ATP-binding protein